MAALMEWLPDAGLVLLGLVAIAALFVVIVLALGWKW
jgi:hypothetical protein